MKYGGNTMFLFKGDTLKHETEIRGVKYITVSHYNGDRDIFEKIGGLIAESFSSSEVDKFTKESLLGSDMDTESANKKSTGN